LRIELYFRQIHREIESCPVIRLVNIAEEKRGTYEGYIYGELTFLDDSILQFREYVDVEDQADRLMYSYHYTDTDDNLIFRYDNTGHHRKLKLTTYPHHKHEGSQNNLLSSSAPILAMVLDEIQARVVLP
jgi:hypothetical protein